MKSVAPSTPAIPATSVAPTSAQAGDALLDSVAAAETAAEANPDASDAVRQVQGTAAGHLQKQQYRRHNSIRY